MKILIIEPYFTGSHADWVRGYKKFSRHDVQILSLSGQFWKWRMHGGAVTLAQKFLQSDFLPNFVLATDMLDLTTFLALTREKTHSIPTAIYFHENQICYPWSPDDRDVRQNRDRHYGFINYASALAADAIFFNSQFHQTAFFEELPRMLKHLPDHRGLENVEKLKNKSQVLHLGLDLARFDKFRVNEKPDKPLILWNHRWEYDKNPTDFFNALYVLHSEGLEFEVVVLGENFSQNPIEFDIARDKLGYKIIQFGYAETFEDYARWLWRSDIIPVTSRQDFFGASTVEAIYCGCFPILPNRLSFPEIFSIQQYPDNFYNPFDELVDKLIWAVRNIGMVRSQNFKKAVEKYTWEQVAEHYDDILEKLTEISTRKID